MVKTHIEETVETDR